MRATVPLAISRAESGVTSQDESKIYNGYIFNTGEGSAVTQRPGRSVYADASSNIFFTPYHDAEGNVWYLTEGKELFKNTSLATNLETDWLDLATFSDNSAVGTIAWSNPSNAGASDDTNATAVLSAGAITHYLKAVDLSTLALPALSTVVGVEVRIEKSTSAPSSLDTGYVVVGTGANETSVGTKAWLSPTRINANDDNDTAGLFVGSAGEISNYILGTNLGLSVPTNATILGVEVQVEKYALGPGVTKDYSVKLFSAGAAIGNNKADLSTQWSTSRTSVVYGSSTDTWGADLTPAIVNSSTFGAALACQHMDGNPNSFSMDYMSIKVYYKVYPVDSTVKLVIGGTVSGTNQATTDAWPTNDDTYVTYGGPQSLWGTTPTQADVEGATFGVVISATVAAGTPTISVDHIQIKIHYRSTSGAALSNLYTANGITWAENDKYIYVHGGGSSAGGKSDYYVYKDVVSQGAVVEITDADHPLNKATADESPPGVAAVGGYFFVIGNHVATTTVDTGFTRIYNCAINDPTSWDSTNYIASSKPGYLKYLAEHHNHVVAFGESGIEFFYNAGNPTGSPLSKRLDIDYNVGIVSQELYGTEDNSHSLVAKYGDELYFLGRPTHGGMGVYALKNFQLSRVSTPAIDKLLDEDTSVIRGMLSFNNKDFLIVNADWAGTTSLVYDLEANKWYEWGVNYNRGVSFNILAIDNSNDIFIADAITDDDATFECYVITPPLNSVGDSTVNTLNLRKYCSELSVVSYRPGSETLVSVSWSDDDGVTWSTARTLDINSARNKLTRLGNFTQRRFKLSYTGSTSIKLFFIVLILTLGM
jgi:hypothetical protein